MSRFTKKQLMKIGQDAADRAQGFDCMTSPIDSLMIGMEDCLADPPSYDERVDPFIDEEIILVFYRKTSAEFVEEMVGAFTAVDDTQQNLVHASSNRYNTARLDVFM